MIKNKNVIVLIILFIVVLTVLSILFTTGVITLKHGGEAGENVTNNISNDVVTKPVKDDNYVKYEFDFKDAVDNCIEISNRGYYTSEINEIVVNNININGNNYRYRYVGNFEDRTVNVYLNDVKAFSGNKSEALLLNVCNYGNYVAYSVGWESLPYYRVINTDGEISMEFSSSNVTYTGGMLNVQEYNRVNENITEIFEYQLDMNSATLEKLNLKEVSTLPSD